MKPKHVFRIFFTSHGKMYEIYARQVVQGEMYGFVEVEDIVFGEKSSIVLDPSEESLKKEFSGVKRLMIPYHAVVRIEEVEKEGSGKILALDGGQTGTPSMPPPGGGRKE